ncbi:MAG TPA: hypothetical protein VGM90_28680 [Kofleriaceae bacterium]|jgi:acyl carrier protein
MSKHDEIRDQVMAILTEADLLDDHGTLIAPDSMGIVLIAMEIEVRWAPIPQADLKVSNFNSIDSIVAMVETLLQP